MNLLVNKNQILLDLIDKLFKKMIEFIDKALLLPLQNFEPS